ncbi:MAG: hypothetical protein WBA17_18155 [Saprospiraceae bacterium]
MNDLQDILASLSQYSIGLPFIIGSIFFGRLIREQRMVWFFVIVSLFFEVAADYRVGFIEWVFGVPGNNLPGLHLFTIAQYVMILVIYGRFLRQFIPNTVFWAILIAFPIWGIMSATFIDGWYNYNPHARAVQIISILILILCYFYQLLKNVEINRLESDPLFWVSCGLLIYFSGSLFIFLMSNYFLANKNYELLDSIYGMHSILNIIANLAYTIALWINSRKPISP